MTPLPKRDDIDVAVALGLLLVAAITHLTAQPQYCCRDCCPQCAALDFYREEIPDRAALAVGKALTGPVDWLMDGGHINWPYLVQFWNVPDTHTCNPSDEAALITV